MKLLAIGLLFVLSGMTGECAPTIASRLQQKLVQQNYAQRILGQLNSKQDDQPADTPTTDATTPDQALDTTQMDQNMAGTDEGGME